MSTTVQERVFRAVADPTRREILDLLRGGELRAGEIAGAFPVSRPAVSKHLRVLRQAELVERRKAGRRRLYRLNPEPLRQVDDWVSRYEEFWEASLGRLKEHVEERESGQDGADEPADATTTHQGAAATIHHGDTPATHHGRDDT